ncbi:FecR family protein [Spirosoma daeguense]
MKPTLSKQIIWNFFEGKTTPMQNTLIQEWLAEPGYQELYFQWLEEWERENPQFTPNVELAYARSLQFAQGIDIPHEGDTQPVTEPFIRSFSNRFRVFQWVAAACVVLLAGAYLLRNEWYYKRYETGYGEVRTIRLSDNSRVSLNAHSVLTVPRFGFGSGQREVQLTGEAEFAIQHMPDHQRFIVRTPDQLEVQVLGTEFIVYSRERGSKVVLSQGKVQLRQLNNLTVKPVIMLPGDIATLSHEGHFSLRHQQRLPTHQAWKHRRFMFENTSVAEIAYQISEHFGVNVVVSDSALSRRTLGGTFQTDSAMSVLQVLADILNVQITQTKQSNQTVERDARSGVPTQTYVLTPLPKSIP